MNEKISIIIPAYNIERELPATLDNVLAQTYEKLEIIVVRTTALARELRQ